MSKSNSLKDYEALENKYEELKAKYEQLEYRHKTYCESLGIQMKVMFQSAAKYGYKHGTGGNLMNNMYYDWLKKEGEMFLPIVQEEDK